MAFRRFNHNHLSSSSKLEDEAVSTIYSDNAPNGPRLTGIIDIKIFSSMKVEVAALMSQSDVTGRCVMSRVARALKQLQVRVHHIHSTSTPSHPIFHFVFNILAKLKRGA